jgi:hypothetical protein
MLIYYKSKYNYDLENLPEGIKTIVFGSYCHFKSKFINVPSSLEEVTFYKYSYYSENIRNNMIIGNQGNMNVIIGAPEIYRPIHGLPEYIKINRLCLFNRIIGM